MDKTETTQLDEGEMFYRPGHLVRRLHQICVSVFLNEAEDLNLTSVQFAALKGIERSPGIEQISLARAIAIDRQTASNVLGRLQSRGLIEKRDKDNYYEYNDHHRVDSKKVDNEEVHYNNNEDINNVSLKRVSYEQFDHTSPEYQLYERRGARLQ